MGNFLVVQAANARHSQARRLFREGLKRAPHGATHAECRTLEYETTFAAVFPRQKAASPPAVCEDSAGNWLIASGAWFHVDETVADERRLLARYIETGPGRLAQELEGFFVVIAGDAAGEMAVITDIAGSCHAFIRQFEGVAVLGGSSLMLAAMGDYTLDPIACQEFLNTGVIYEDRTLYKEVRKLAGATVFRFSDGRLKQKQCYWRVADLSPGSIDEQAAPALLAERLSVAASRIGRRFARPVCDLTGGYDSRAIVASFLTANIPFSTTVSGDAQSADVRISAGLARVLGLQHSHVVPDEPVSFKHVQESVAFTDGEYDPVDYARILGVHRILSERFDISINGSFGEVGRGYWWELLWPRAGQRRPLDSRKLARLRYVIHPYDGSLFPPEARLDLVSHFAGIIDRTNSHYTGLPNTTQMDHAYLTMRMQRWQGRIASSTDRLWPCLSPFLFRSVLETMLEAPVRLRRRGLLIRRMLAEVQPRLAGFPLEHGYPALPVTWRSFYRFAPLLGLYGGKVVSRMTRMLKLNLSRNDAASTAIPVRLRLWQEDDVQDLFSSNNMGVTRVLDERSLRDFLTRSQQRDFAFPDQWNRLLGLEYTLNALKEQNFTRSPFLWC